ncbi:OB-fold domain-containing protein [Pigmentiphaga soli]|uniref:OB-fold domain-containing protein n=1 Tax=Pigmentiphaga soli TaxID=1007095 RepID=A0ABP8GMY8_9BURK
MNERTKIADKPPYNKPLPTPSAMARPFWDALRNGELRLQHCPACGHFNHPPRLLCSKCHNRDLKWDKVEPSGTVYSYTIVHRPPFPVFKEDVPYAVGLVDIDGTDVRMLGSLLAPLDAISVGMRVKVIFDDVTDDFTLFRFQSMDATAGAQS